MPVLHSLKIWPRYFEAVKKGLKTFEVRVEDDKKFAFGDYVTLKEYDPDRTYDVYSRSFTGPMKGYTGEEISFKIGYVLPIEVTKEGHSKVVFSLLPIRDQDA